ncbi:MAG: hypothetical protein IKS22_13895 [Bacteroidales bacterium]|nr:hypothetical protein [Bacteroidales bacterium]
MASYQRYGYVNYQILSVEELLSRINDSVYDGIPCAEPILLLFDDGDDYYSVLRILSKKYNTKNIGTDPNYFKFVRVNNNLEMSFNGDIIDEHHPEIDVYEYTGGPLGYDKKILSYCRDLVDYEDLEKPVLCLFCLEDKNCSLDDIPEWVCDDFEIDLIKCH